MNNDLGKIFHAIHEVDKKVVAIQVIQKTRHEENIRYMKKLDNIPCQKMAERVKWLNRGVLALFGIVGTIIGIYIKVNMGG